MPKPNNGVCPKNYFLEENICQEICSGINCSNKYFYNYICLENKCLVCVDNKLKIFSNCDNSKECNNLEGCLNCITSDECITFISNKAFITIFISIY